MFYSHSLHEIRYVELDARILTKRWSRKPLVIDVTDFTSLINIDRCPYYHRYIVVSTLELNNIGRQKRSSTNYRKRFVEVLRENKQNYLMRTEAY